MKVFIYILYISTSFAGELERRLELYGLTETKEPILYNSLIEHDDTIIHDLQKDIKTQYIPKVQETLGECHSTNCLQDNGNYLSLNTSQGNICLPYTQCGFYHCMENKYKCLNEGVNYFTHLAFPTCSQYTQNIKKNYFSQQGYEWIYSVMVCLQKGLVDECEVKSNCTKESQKESCNYITEFTLNFHPGCYLNSGIGVCKLPLKDKINIFRTVSKYLTPRERQEAIEVVKTCIKQGF